MHPLQDAEFSPLLLLTTTTKTNVENWCNNCNSRNKTKLKEKIPHFFPEFLSKISSLQDCRVAAAAAAAVSKKKIAARNTENPSTYLHATKQHTLQTDTPQAKKPTMLTSFLASCRRNSADPAGFLLAEERVEKLGATKASGRANEHDPCRDNARSRPAFQLHEEDNNAQHQRQRRPQSSSGSSPCLCSYPPTYSSRRYLPYLLPLGQLCIGIPSFFLLLPTALV